MRPKCQKEKNNRHNKRAKSMNLRQAGRETKCWFNHMAIRWWQRGQRQRKHLTGQLSSCIIHKPFNSLLHARENLARGKRMRKKKNRNMNPAFCSRSPWPYFSSEPACQKALQTKVSMHVVLMVLTGESAQCERMPLLLSFHCSLAGYKFKNWHDTLKP